MNLEEFYNIQYTENQRNHIRENIRTSQGLTGVQWVYAIPILLEISNTLWRTASDNYSAETAPNFKNLLDNISAYCKEPDRNYVYLIEIKRGISFARNYLEENNFEEKRNFSIALQLNTQHKIYVYDYKGIMLILTNGIYPTTLNFIKRLTVATASFFKKEEYPESLIEYLKALADEDEEKTINAFTKYIAYKIDFRKLEEQKLLKALQETDKARINALNLNKNEIEAQLGNTEAALCEYIKRLDDINAQIAFYKPSTNIEEITEYIRANKNIAAFHYNAAYKILSFAIEAPIEYYNENALKKLIANPTSFIQPRAQNGYPVPEYLKQNQELFTKLLLDIFISKKYKIYSRAEFSIDMANRTVQRLRTLSTSSVDRPLDWKWERRVKNPTRSIADHQHVEQYNCWSGNRANALKALQKNDIIQMLEILIATTKDINVLDSTVFARFVYQQLVAFKSWENILVYTRPDDMARTIYDPAQDKFRTFYDIFMNDYLNPTLPPKREELPF